MDGVAVDVVGARSEQPVRMETVAKVLQAMASRLTVVATGATSAGEGSESSVRVLPSHVLWHAAQQRDVGAVIDA
jgi:hypothetical protein